MVTAAHQSAGFRIPRMLWRNGSGDIFLAFATGNPGAFSIELGLKGRQAEIVSRFAESPEDAARFRAAFPGEEPTATLPYIVKAIASFERLLVPGDSPFDRYMHQDDRGAMSPEALWGMQLLFSGRLRCSKCHAGFNLSGPQNYEGAEAVDPAFHNTGLYDVDGRGSNPPNDRSLFDKTKKASDMGRFCAPTLRNVSVTTPYMHDGSMATLEAAV